MKTLLQTLILTLVSTTFFSQTLHFDSIPVPECIQWNLYEPGFAVSNTGRLHYGGRDGTYSSSDNGATWDTATYDWTNFMPVNSVAVATSGNVYIGASDYGGFAMSTDSGASFTRLTSTYCRAIHCDKYGNVFAALGGILRKFPDGNYNAGSTVLGVPGGAVYNISEGEQGEMYAVMKEYIYMSSDTGNTWVLKKDLSSATRAEFTHVVAGNNGEVIFGERYTSTYKTDTSFATDSIIGGRPGLNSVKTKDGFIFIPNRFDQWLMSMDNGVTFTDYYGTAFNTLTAGVRVPRMGAAEYPYHSLATRGNKVYFAGYNCQILVISKGASTSIDNKKIDRKISVYPNPINNNGMLTIDGVENGDRLVIRDITGKEVVSYNNGENTIKISGYKSGVYFLTVYSENQMKTVKFLVK